MLLRSISNTLLTVIHANFVKCGIRYGIKVKSTLEPAQILDQKSYQPLFCANMENMFWSVIHERAYNCFLELCNLCAKHAKAINSNIGYFIFSNPYTDSLIFEAPNDGTELKKLIEKNLGTACGWQWNWMGGNGQIMTVPLWF